MIPIRTRLTLVVVLATVTGAIVGWLLRHHPIVSGAFVGGVAAAAVAVFVVSRMLVTDPATSILQAVSDGLLSFSEREYGMRLAAPNADEVLGDLVRRFNKLGEALRTEHNDRYQREILLETVLETTSMAIVLCNEALRIVYANGAARELFGEGRKLDGQDFRAILAAAPAAFRQAIEQETDTIFSVETATSPEDAGRAGAPETYHLARRYFQLSMQPHILFILKPLTRAILRKEADTWKRTIRVISHEINNSLAPISSLIHSEPPDAAEARDDPAARRGAGHDRGAQRAPARLHRGLREVRAPADARQADPPLAAAGRRPAPALLVPGRGPAAGAARACSTPDRCSRC